MRRMVILVLGLSFMLGMAGTARTEDDLHVARLEPSSSERQVLFAREGGGVSLALGLIPGPEGEDMLRFGEVVSLLGWNYTWDGASRTAEVSRGGGDKSPVRITVGALRFGSAEEVALLPSPLQLWNGELVMPPQSVARFVSLMEGVPVRWDTPNRRLLLGKRGETTSPGEGSAPSANTGGLLSVPDEPRPASAASLGGNRGEETVPHFLRTIVLDPGHGGKDPGAVGPTGLEEKNVTLAVAKEVKKELERMLPGTKILLTREDDRYVSLGDRTQFAARMRADLFVSIHINAHTRQATGTETYFFADPSDADAARVAEREGVFDPNRGMGTDLDKTLIDLRLAGNIMESSAFAEMVQRALVGKLRLPDRGVKSARFFVLHYGVVNEIPSILVEVAFISNPREEALLKKDSFIENSAEGIHLGMSTFIRDLERRYPGGQGWRQE